MPHLNITVLCPTLIAGTPSSASHLVNATCASKVLPPAKIQPALPPQPPQTRFFFCLFVVNYLISLCLPPNHCCLPQLTSTAWRASCLDLLAGKSGSLGKLLRLTGRSRITFHAVCCVKSWLGIVTGRTVMPNTSVDLRVACYCMHNHTLHTDPTKKARKPPVASDLCPRKDGSVNWTNIYPCC